MVFKEYTQNELIGLNKKSLSEGYLHKKYKMKYEVDDALGQVVEYIKVWENCAENMKNSDEKTHSGMIGGEAKKVYNSKKFLAGDLIKKACFYSLAVSQSNSLMGKIVAAPTAGSSGVIPGVVMSIRETYGMDDLKVAKSVFAGIAIGEIIHKRASFAGSELGCQAEIGSAAAMGAAIAVDLMGGSSSESVQAATLALKNMLGLTCDPVACLVEVPCVKRNSIGASISLTSASLAMCGIESKIPFHEVVDTMQETGRKMDFTLRETSKGGLAMTPTGIKIMKKIKKI